MPVKLTLVVLAAMLLALVSAAPADASVARVQFNPGTNAPKPGFGTPPSRALQYDASPGEANLVSIAGGTGGITIVDFGAAIQAAEGCTQLDPNSVVCVADYASVRTGDAADRVEVRPPVATLDTGAGDDAVFLRSESAGSVSLGDGDDRISSEGLGRLEPIFVAGDAGNDSLAGGPAADTIYGGPGDDVLDGGPRNDTLAPGAGRDTVAGGEGLDEVAYATDSTLSGQRTGTVSDALRIDLVAQRVTGSAGKRDSLNGVENAKGAAAADVLLGTPGPNVLDGARGDDRLVGRAGADVLLGEPGDGKVSGGSGNDTVGGESGRDVVSGGRGNDKLGDEFDTGRDRFSGGPGRDRFETFDGARDSVRCGDGRDFVFDADAFDRLRGCERADRR